MKRLFFLAATLWLSLLASAQEGLPMRRLHIEHVTHDDGLVAGDARQHRALGSAAEAPLPCMGSPKVPVILVQFDDLKFTVADTDEGVAEKYVAMFNAGEDVHPNGSFGSVREYFRQQSDGQFAPSFGIIGPVTLPKSYKHYGENSATRKDVNIEEFYSTACQLAVQQDVDWSDYDNNEDGTVDFVFFIYAGFGENAVQDDDPYTIWPKESSSSMRVTYDEKTIVFGAFGCTNELLTANVMDGIGASIHELGHGLGLPDFYDTNYVGYGLDAWDIMDSGCYQRYSFQPCGMSAYERDFMGWRKLVTLEVDEPYSLTLKPLEEDGVGYKVVNKANENEYFILENRQNIGFDGYFGWLDMKVDDPLYRPAHGLLITHVDYNKAAWSENKVNTVADHQRITIVPADGDLVSNAVNGSSNETWKKSNRGDLYPNVDNVTEMTSYAVFTGETLGQTIDNIAEDEQGIITLDINGGVKAEEPEDPGVPDAIAGIEVGSGAGYEVYTLSGQKVKGLQSGVNIVKYRGGQIRKVLKQ